MSESKKKDKRKAIDEAPEAADDDEDEEDQDWKLTSEHLEPGDLALILFDHRILEVTVRAKSTDYFTLIVDRTQLRDVNYPWSKTALPNAIDKAEYAKRTEDKELDIHDNHVSIHLKRGQKQAPLIVFVIARIKFCSNTGRRIPFYCSIWKNFHDHYLNCGDVIDVIPQGALCTHCSSDDVQPKIRFRSARVTKVQDSDMIRLSYRGTQNAEYDVVQRNTLRCWTRTSSGVPTLVPSLPWQRATEEPPSAASAAASAANP